MIDKNKNSYGRVITDFVETAQLRELQAEIAKIKSKINQVETITETLKEEITPPLVNFLNNSDFIYSEESYNETSFADDEYVLSNWLSKNQSDMSEWVENQTTLESSESIRRAGHSDGTRPFVEWDDSAGAILLTGGQRISSKLALMSAFSGNYLVARLQLWKHDSLASITPNIIIKISLWDNMTKSILKGAKPVLSATKVGSHTGGTNTRQYILEVGMPDGRSFYSHTTSFTNGQNQVTNCVSASVINNNNSVSITWKRVLGASKYRIYRKEGSGNWYLLGTLSPSTTSFVDVGGVGGGIWTIPVFDETNLEFQECSAYFMGIGNYLQNTNVNEFSFGLRVPDNFSPVGDQFIQIEFLKSNYAYTDSDDIPIKSIAIDKIGLSYTNGRWMPSPKDLSLSPVPVGTVEPPPYGGGSGTNPPSGGGIINRQEEPILILE